jgi:hypothetical protein
MSLIAELAKMQERKETLLQELALIDRELDSAAETLGVVRRKADPIHQTHGMGARPPRTRTANGQSWRTIEFWLRNQATAKTWREIAEGTVMTLAATQAQLSKHASELIHRGNRWGLSESQFADHAADLEEQRRGTETPSPSTEPTAHSLNGVTASLSALTTTASTALDATAPATSPKHG